MSKTIVVQVWDNDCDSNTLLVRVRVPLSELKSFKRRVEKKWAYSVEVEERTVLGWDWYYKELRKDRNARRRARYWRNHKGKDSKSPIMDFYDKLLLDEHRPVYILKENKEGIPTGILDNNNKEIKRGDVITFRKYKSEKIFWKQWAELFKKFFKKDDE